MKKVSSDPAVPVSSSGHKPRALELDLLRFLAATAVMLYHFTYRRMGDTDAVALFPAAETVTKFGYLGVNLFFMISGYVILLTALDRRPADFLRSRFVRLYPTFWAGMTVTTIAVLLLGEPRFTAVDFVKNMTMVSGYLGSEYIDGVYWTLQLELKFYALVFLLIVTKQMNHAERWLYAWLASSICCHFFPGAAVLKSLSIYPYSFYFIAGGLFFLTRIEGFSPYRAVGIVVCLGFSLLEATDESTGFLFGSSDHAQLVVHAVVAACYAAFICMVAFDLGKYMPKGVTTLGALTYPLYLIHNRAGKLLYDWLLPSLGKYLALACVILAVVAVSWAIVQLIEHRFSRWVDAVLKSLPGFRPSTATAAASKQ